MSGLMDGINEAFESAGDEPVGEADEVVSEESQEEKAQEAPEVEDQGAAEEQPEPEQEDEPEDSGEAEEPAGDLPKWLEHVEEVPTAELPPRVAKLRSDRDRLASELGEMRKRLAELEEAGQKQQEPQQPEAPDPMPEYPTADDDFEAVVRKMDAIADWRARQAVREQDSRYQEKFQSVEELKKAQEEQRQQAQLQQQQQFFVSQAQRIESSPDYNEAVRDEMVKMTSSAPHWQQAVFSEQGWDELFEVAKHRVSQAQGQAQARSKQQQMATKKATARQRAVPRGSNPPKQTSPDVEVPDDPANVGGRVGAIFDHFAGS
jgi:hypothetical protein